MNVYDWLSIDFIGWYNSAKKKGITFIPDTVVAKIVMGKLYDEFVRQGLLTKIEYLPVEEKVELTNECREVKDVLYTNKSLTENCRILHLIKFINKTS